MNLASLPRKASRQHAFTLIEILIVLAIIIGVLAGLGVPMYQRAQQQSQIASAVQSISAAKAAIALYNNSQDGLPLPVTRVPSGGTIPTTGTLGGVALQHYIDLQTVLLRARCLEAPIAVRIGETGTPDLTIPVQWDPTTQTFFTTGDAAPTTVYTTAGVAHLYPRLALMSAASGGVTFSGIQLQNFALDGTNYFTAGTRVVHWIWPKVDANVAYELARTVYKGTVAAAGSAQTVGPIVYPAADTSGKTTVCAYVAHY